MSEIDKDYTFNRVYQPLNLTAKLKTCAEDFVVEELMDVTFSGEGEHCWLYLEKRECNTDWVAQQLAKFCRVNTNAVSYAGLKDRHAVTSQWFSVQLPGKETPDWSEFEAFFQNNSKASGHDEADQGEHIRVLQSFRHNKKLQRGVLRGNRFTLRLRELSDTSDVTFDALSRRCQQISSHGVPNYFGEQRFGRNRNNLDQALKYFLSPNKRLATKRLSKHKRGLYFSAARSWLFNHILSQRIAVSAWDRRLAGDVFLPDGSMDSICDDSTAIEEADSRLARNEIHPSASMWGENDSQVSGAAAELEQRVLQQFPVFREGLVAARVQSQRRATRVVPAMMQCRRQGDDLLLGFELPAGSYATMVLAEIISDEP